MSINKFIFTFLIFLAAIKVYALGTGDNLYTELHKWKSIHETECPAMSGWYEEQHLLMLWSNEDSSGTLYFIATPDKKLIAECLAIGGSNMYLMDTNNDSIVDAVSPLFYMSYEFIKHKTKIVSQDTSVLRMLNHFYAISMQADELADLDKKEVEFMKQFFNDSTLNNRQLVYLFSTYTRLISQAHKIHLTYTSPLCIPIAQAFADECNLVYKKIPPIACIYVVESLLTDTTKSDQARTAIKTYLKTYPDCIPLQVYDYQLEQDEKVKVQELQALRKNHPNHWMVKQL